MPITGLPGLPSGITAGAQRGVALGNRVADSDLRAERDSQELPRPQAEKPVTEEGIQPQPALRQVIEAVDRQKDVSLRRRQDDENLSFTAQKALKAFADNTPSPGQQLGIELAGIDTFA